MRGRNPFLGALGRLRSVISLPGYRRSSRRRSLQPSPGAETPVLDWRERLVCSRCGQPLDRHDGDWRAPIGDRDAEIEDFLEGFNQPTYRGMRVGGVRVAVWSSRHGWSGM